MEIKVCIECKDEKSIDEFNKDKLRKEGLCPYCKKCQSEKNKKWRKENPEKTKKYSKKSRRKNSEKIKTRNKKYCKENSEKIKVRRRKWYNKNLEKIKIKDKKYRKENKEKAKNAKRKWYEKNPEYKSGYYKKNLKRIKAVHKKWKKNNPEYHKKRRQNDHVIRLNNTISSGIKRSLKVNKNGRHWEFLVGYTLDDLKNHLELQFKKGMNWENQGKNGWVIDHILPISKWNITSAECEDFKRCWALSNLQPLWEKDNLKKSNKITELKSQLELVF